MRKILIVDDDPANRNHLSYELKPYGDIEIIEAESAKQAAKLTDFHAFDLVVTELDLPGIDGLKLLAFLKKKIPDVCTMAMARQYTPRMKSGMTHFRVVHHFTKPLDMDLVVDAILQELGLGGGGRIHGISLASFLQLVDLEQKTCTLIVKSRNRRGSIFCREGNVIAAEAEGETGKFALYRLLFWERAVIEVEEGCRNSRREIDQPLMYLLMEGHRMKDEIEGEPAPISPRIETEMKADSPVIDMEPNARIGDDNGANGKRLQTLSRGLKRAPEIFEYGIYDRFDRILDHRGASDTLSRLTPSALFDPGDALADPLGGGGLGYMELTVKGHTRYAVCGNEGFFIVMGIEPGFRTSNLIRKYKLLS